MNATASRTHTIDSLRLMFSVRLLAHSVRSLCSLCPQVPPLLGTIGTLHFDPLVLLVRRPLSPSASCTDATSVTSLFFSLIWPVDRLFNADLTPLFGENFALGLLESSPFAAAPALLAPRPLPPHQVSSSSNSWVRFGVSLSAKRGINCTRGRISLALSARCCRRRSRCHRRRIQVLAMISG